MESTGIRCLRFTIFFPAAASILLFSLFSCSQPHTPAVFIPENDTLRSLTREKADTTQWTRELEPWRLVQPEESPDSADTTENGEAAAPVSVPEKMPVTYEIRSALPLSDLNRARALYPSLAGFGSLDISDMSAGAVSLVNRFMQGLADSADVSGLMQNSRWYLYHITRAELEPLAGIQSWVIGSPVIDGQRSPKVYEIPVLVYGTTGRLRIWLYISSAADPSDEKPYLIDQIQIGEVISE